MVIVKKLRESIAAVLDRHAHATRPWACDGCDHLCNAAVSATVQIGDTMRFLMSLDAYGDPGKARDLFAKRPGEARALSQDDGWARNRTKVPFAGIDLPLA